MARHIIGRQPYKWAIGQCRGTPQPNNLDRSKEHFRIKFVSVSGFFTCDHLSYVFL